jgi:hypothetical protein
MPLHRRRELAGDDVGGAARREGHDDTNWSRWEICGGLGAGAGSCYQQTSNNNCEAAQEAAHDVLPL